ncbi:MAG: UvrD-helicase domain-containing protein [Desulfovibrionaceae bacterium]|nr:UvrD-helicase domain-containing protein [Desulfovibrionaceae bacterium]
MFGLYQIKASAGSGKTHTLTKRFLKLLSTSNNLEEIVAITFTNAAADEMRQRIIRTLKNIALGSDPYGNDKNDPLNINKDQAAVFLNKILDNLSNLNVRTIDSLLMQIVRTSSLQLHLNPDFTPTFSTEDTIEPYLDKICDRAKSDDANLYDFVEDVLRNLYIENNTQGFLASKKLPSKLNPLFDDILLKRCHDITPLDTLKKARKNIRSNIAKTAEIILNSNAQALTRNYNNLLQTLTKIDLDQKDFEKKLDSAFFKKESLEGALLKGNVADPASQEAFALICQQKNNYWLLADAIKTRPLISLGELLNEEFMRSEASGLYLHTAQVPALALAIFAGIVEISDALFRLGNRITHLLVDEFQDTSTEQWNAIRPLVQEVLSHEGSFTWVGDIKQSIFSWRNGNPKLFDAILQDQEITSIAQGHIHLETLPDNWRSCPTIVEFNNSLFASLMESQTALDVVNGVVAKDMPDEIKEEAATLLSNVFASVEQEIPKTKKKNATAKNQGYVKIVEIEDNDEDEEILKAIAERLKDLHESRPWNDFLILERTNDDSNVLADYLTSLDIPVITENSLLLSQNSLIIQSLAFLRFMVQKDNLSLLTLLKGDIMHEHGKTAHLNLEEFTDLVFDEEDNNTLAQILESGWNDLWKKCWESFFEYSNFLSPYDLLQEWYHFFDVEQRFPNEQVFLRRFLEMMHAAEDENGGTISNFLEFWEKYGLTEKIPMPDNMDACRIMTIHKAKGLEAKVVILPCTKGRIGPRSDLIYFDYQDTDEEPLRLALKRNKHVPRAYYDDYLRNLGECFHVLYVATTRAREELYIIHKANPAKANEPEDQNRGDILMQLLAQAKLSLPLQLGQKVAQGQSNNSPKAGTTFSLSPKNKENDFQPAVWIKSLKVAHTRDRETQETAKNLGKLFHTALEFIPTNADPLDLRVDSAIRYALWRNHLPDTLDRDLEHLRESLRWFLNQPGVNLWLETGWREHSFMTPRGDLLRCDLIVQTNKGFLVVDYKSGSSQEEHYNQIRKYMLSLQKCLAAKIAGVLVYFDKKYFEAVNQKNQSNPTEKLADLKLDNWF